MVRSSVDFPQPLGPTIVVTLPSGMVEDEVADDRVAAVPDGDGARRADGLGGRDGAHADTFRLVRRSS